jgi:hypothetical protein
MLFMQKRKPPERAPSFTGKLLERDPAELAISGKAEEIAAYFAANPGKAAPELQESLAERYQSDAHWRANARLLAPIMLAAISSAMLGEAMRLADRLNMTIGFGCAVFAAAFLGRSLSLRFERGLSRLIPGIMEAGGASAERAQEHYSFTVLEGQDAEAAFSLLCSGKVTSAGARERLAETIGDHGTKEQAKAILDKGCLGELDALALRRKAGIEQGAL